MSRDITATNLTQMQTASTSEVWLVKIEVDDVFRAHTGIGSLTFNGEEYTGVGHLGAISEMSESVQITTNPLTMRLSHVNPVMLAYALDAAQFGAPVTVWKGFIVNGALADDPIERFKGYLDATAIRYGTEGQITVTVQHELADLERAREDRYSDEDQQGKFAGDVGFEYITEIGRQKLLWAGGTVGNLGSGQGSKGFKGGDR